MNHIKIFEAFFDKSEILFEFVSQSQLEEFTSTHDGEDISNNELYRISKIFGLEFKLNSGSKIAYAVGFSMDLTGPQKMYPRVFSKFSDDWWVLIVYNYDTKSNMRIICDGISGIRKYTQSLLNR